LEILNELLDNLINEINKLPVEEKIDKLNYIKQKLHEASPFKNEPVDCVIWVKNENIFANDYNPNTVAPPEMKLLRLSIDHDGYTQPIVTIKHNENSVEVVDGFHRNRVGREDEEIKKRIYGYLPVTFIRTTQEDINNRVASTIRHNRARGKHTVIGMSEIVVDLKKRNWSYAKIAKELGMDRDEVLRLTQISGITEMFANKEFSQAWESDEIFEKDVNEIEEIE